MSLRHSEGVRMNHRSNESVLIVFIYFFQATVMLGLRIQHVHVQYAEEEKNKSHAPDTLMFHFCHIMRQNDLTGTFQSFSKTIFISKYIF